MDRMAKMAKMASARRMTQRYGKDRIDRTNRMGGRGFGMGCVVRLST
jgi:hypothetical protein